MITKNCHICNKEIRVPSWKFRSYRNRPANKHFFCSRICYVFYWKKYRVCIRGNGITKNCEWCNKKFHRRKRNDGRTERFCSSKCCGKWREGKFIGENNPYWKGGKKPQPERYRIKYRKWQLSVTKRDKKCNLCGSIKFLQAHHIKSWKLYPKLRYDINNGITLCRTCHGKNRNYNPVTTLLKKQEV